MLLWLCGLLLAAPGWAEPLLVDVLDVGQGDAILVRGGGKAVLIDAGLRKSDTVGQLRRLGVTSLDLLVSSHPHADHIGGMEDVVRGLPVKLYMDNGMTHTTQTYAKLMTAVEERGVAYRTAEAGTRISLGEEASFTVLFPGAALLRGTRSDLNSNSVVLHLQHGEVDFLFTGDAELQTEQALARESLDQIEVLKVAHHGSGHSSSARFLDAVSPEIAVISCGQDNRYGHPYPETLERLAAVNAQVYRTDLSGHIRLISDGVGVEVLEGSLREIVGLNILLSQPTRRAESPVESAGNATMSGPRPADTADTGSTLPGDTVPTEAPAKKRRCPFKKKKDAA